MQERSLPLSKPVSRTILNAILFQCGWFACVLGGDVFALLATPVLLLLHQWLANPSRAEWLFISAVGLIGLVADSLLSAFSVFQFEYPSLGLIPIWLLCLWLLFACTLRHSLSWLQHRLPLACLLGAVSGPMSYYAGSQLAPVMLAEPVILSLIVVGLIWGLLLPLMMIVARRI